YQQAHLPLLQVRPLRQRPRPMGPGQPPDPLRCRPRPVSPTRHRATDRAALSPEQSIPILEGSKRPVSAAGVKEAHLTHRGRRTSSPANHATYHQNPSDSPYTCHTCPDICKHVLHTARRQGLPYGKEVWLEKTLY